MIKVGIVNSKKCIWFLWKFSTKENWCST